MPHGVRDLEGLITTTQVTENSLRYLKFSWNYNIMMDPKGVGYEGTDRTDPVRFLLKAVISKFQNEVKM